MAKVFKARYYPNGTFLDAELRANPSYVWHSVMEAQHLVKSNVRWRIGNGNLVSIWGELWLRDEHHPSIRSLMAVGLQNACNT